jgi:uncharacterized repeat protein (TIGR01451 family)
VATARVRRIASFLLLVGAALAPGAALATTTINHQFTPATINPGDVSVYKITIANTSLVPLTAAAVTEVFPPQITIASPAGITNTCGFTVNAATPGTSTVFLTAGTIPAHVGAVDGQCTFQLNVTATAQGSWVATIPATTTPNATTSGYTAKESGVDVFNNTPANATLLVNAMSPPTGAKAFSAPRNAGTPFTLTMTLTNPNATATIPLTTVVDSLPAGMQVATPPGAGVVCTGTGASNGAVTAVAGSGSVTLTGGAIGQGGTCTVTVSVLVPTIAVSPTAFNNALASGAIGNTRGLTSPAFNQSVNVTTPISVTKTFGTLLVPAGQPSLMTIVISNASAANALPISSFADNLTGTTLKILNTASAPVAAPANPAVVCSGVGAVNGTLSAPADLINQTISLTGATAGRSGNCTITAYLTSTVDGAHVNNIAANAVVNPANFPSPAASATLTANAQLTVAKAVTVANVAPGQWTQFTVTINNFSGGAVSGIVFKDVLPANGANQMTLFDAGSGFFFAPDPASGCIGGTFTGTNALGTSTGLPPTAADAGLLWTGGTINGGIPASAPGVCTIAIWARVPASAATGLTFTNTIPTGVAGITGTGPNGGVTNTNAASVNVVTISSGAVTKSFSASPIAQGGLSTLTITIFNRTVTPLTGVNLTDNLPAGLTLAASPLATNTCGGVLQAFPNGTQVILTGGTVASRPIAAQDSNCVITARVTGTALGLKTNTINPADFSTTQGVTLPAAVSANITINSGLGAVKTFTPASVATGGVSRVKITVSNTSNGALTNLSVDDSTFSAGLAVGNPANAATNCAGGPTMVVNPGATDAQLLGAKLAAGGSCDFAFDVVATGAGPWSNTVPAGNITSAEGLSNTAAVTASLAKVAGQININKSFNPVIVTGGTPSVLQIDVINPSGVVLTGVGFTDAYPLGIINYSVPGASTDCTGGTVSAIAGDDKVSLSGATLAAGATCHVFVTATSTRFLNLTNTIPAGSVVSNQGFTNPLPTSATLSTLQGLGVAKAFSPAYVAVSQVSTLQMSLISTFDPNAPSPLTLTGVSYTDTLPVGVFIAATPNASTTCTGTGPGGLAVVNTSNGGSNGLVTISQGTIPPGTTCTISVDTVSNALGAYNNVIPVNAVTTDQGVPNSTQAAATLFVVTKPTVSKAFGNATRNPGQSTTLTVTITNGNTIPLTGVGLTDTLPAGLEIASVPATGGTCATVGGGAVNATAAGNTLSVTGATIAASSSCTFFASVLGNTPGVYINNIPIGSIVDDEGLTNVGATTATLTINAPPTVAKAFSPARIASGGQSTLTITLGNTNAVAQTITNGSPLVDTLPGNVFVATPNGLVNLCTAGAVTAVAGSTTITYANPGAIPPGGCTISVNVTSAVSGTYTNTIAAGQLSTAQGVNQLPATASLGVDAPAPPTIAKSFSPATIPVSGTSTLTIAIGNPNAIALTLTSGFTDTLPANVVVAPVPNVGGTCAGAVTALAGSGAVTWASGSSLPAGGCTITVSVTSATAGSYTNSIPAAALTATDGLVSVSPVLPATAGLVVQPPTPPTVAKSFSPGTINPGDTSILTINLGNSNAAAISLTNPFIDTLPPTVALAAIPNASTNCSGGALTAAALATTVTLTGGSIQPGGCSIVVTVSSSTPGGPYTNTIPAGALQTSAGNNGSTVTANLFVNPNQPPSVSKSFAPASIGPGGISKLSLSLANPNASAATLTSDFVDTLPASVVIATPANLVVGPGCTLANVIALAGGTTVTYQSGGALPANGGCSIQVDVTSATAGTYTNTIAALALKTTVGNNAIPTTAVLLVLTPPTVAKTFTPTSIPLGANSSLTVTLGNVNAVALTLSADFVDTLPALLVLGTPATLTGTCAAGSTTAVAGAGTLTFKSGGTIPAGGCTIVVPVTSATPGSYVNSIPSGALQTTIGSNFLGASAQLDIFEADLSITKTDGVLTVVPGTATTYTIVVTNLGPSPVTNATVADTMPGAPASDTWTCTASAGSSCGAASGAGSIATTTSLLVGGTATFTVVANVSPSVTGSLANTATVTAPANVFDPNLANNTATDTDTLVPTADLSITKSDGVLTVVPGTTTTYTIVASNAGPSAVVNAPVSDVLPAGIASATWTCVASPGSSCGTASGSGNIGANVSLLPGGTATFSLPAVVAPSATGTLVNPVTIGVPAGVTDPTPGNNSATDTDALTPQADMQVVKTGPGTVVPGQNVTYTITATNAGPSTAVTATLADTLPPGTTFVSLASPGGWSCATPPVGTAGAISCSLPSFAPATPAVFTLVVALASSVPNGAVVTNVATVGSSTADPTPGNNTSTTNGTATPVADLSIAKTDGVLNVVPGTTTTYTITVTNVGPSDVTNASVADTLPAAITSDTWTCAASVGSSCATASGVGNIATNLSLLTGGTATYTVVASISQSATGTLVNTATVAPPAGVTDPTPANNSATDTDTLVPTADLSISKTDGVLTVVPGTPTTYTIVVSNAGPSAVVNAPVSDVVPAAIATDNWTCVASAGSSCAAASGNGSIGTTVSLLSGGTATYSVVANISAAATGSLTNTVTVSAPAGATDPTPGNNSASDTDALTPQADMQVVKTGPATVVPGQNVTYTITATNAGPSTAVAATLADTLPPGTTFVSLAAAGGWSCTTPSVGAGGAISCTLAGFAPATPAVFTLVVALAPTVPNGTVVSNTATVGSSTPDPTPGNNTSTTTGSATASADLVIVKTGPPTAVPGGPNVVFTTVITNNGPSDAQLVSVADPTPANLGFVPPNAGDCVTAFPCALGTIPAGGTRTITSTYQIPSNYPPGTPIANTATVSSPTPDPTPANNSSTATVLVPTGVADVAVTKTVDNAAPAVGTNVTFTITASDLGPSDATGVVVTDVLPSGLTFVSAAPSQGTYAPATGVWSIGGILFGTGKTLQIVATVSQPGNIVNTATKTAGNETDPNPSNNSASAVVNGPAAIADIQVQKTVDNPAPAVGANVTFTITVTNAGPSQATNVVVTDHLPPGLTFVSAVPAQGAYVPGTGVWTIGTLANGAVTTLTVTATVSLAGTYVNVALKTGETEFDPNTANDQGSAIVVTGGGGPSLADLSIQKTDSPDPLHVGQQLTYTLLVTNRGPSGASNVTITDPLPGSVTLVSATTSQGGCSGTTTVTCTLGGIAAGDSATVSLVVTVGPAAVPSITNVASVAATETDPNPSDNTSTATTTVTASADIALAKTVSNPTPLVSQTFTFTVTATNNGPSTATGVVVTDLLPPGLAFVSSTPSQGAYVPATGLWTIGTLANGANATLVLTVTAASPGVFTNTATKTAETEFDPNLPNDTASAGGAVGVVADLTITKTHAPASFLRGATGTFSLTVSNVGTGPTIGVATVSDTLPAGLTPTLVSGTGWACGIAAATVTCTRADSLGVGGFWPAISVTASVAQGAAASLSNTATVSGGGDITPGNDTASDTVPVVSSADLSIAKTGPANAIPATNVVYTLVVTNNGPSDAQAVSVADPTPVNLTFVSNSGACTTSFPCSLGTVPAGATRTITTTFAVPANYTAPNPIVNTASVSSTTPDPNPANNSASASTSVAADLAVVKTLSGAAAGGLATYTIVVTNNGPSVATNVVLTDPLPSSVTFWGLTTTQGSCTPGSTVSCALGTLTAGATATVTITVLVPEAPLPRIRNTASVTADQYDPNPTNNSSSADIADVPAVPTLSEWGLMLLGLALALAGARFLRRG